MLHSHERFFTENGKRRVLIVDDEPVNREMLSFILENEYDIITAEDGADAISKIKDNLSMLSIVLLDINMPVMDGFEVMQTMRSDESMRRIPVIVLTSERSAEIKSLRMGASDFIAKPYNLPEVIKARVQRTIELEEDRGIIQSTERDDVTGLLNKEFFYKYAEQFDIHHPDAVMDAAEIDISHFRRINEAYGWSYGDAMLRRMGALLLGLVKEHGGLVGRREEDSFVYYAPHGVDFEALSDAISAGLADGNIGKLRVRIGVYENVDRSLQIQRRFDRAKVAGDEIKNNYAKSVSIYDAKLYEKEFFDDRLVEDVDEALETKQFEVYYQPKFNIQGDVPVLSSAEALIRWKHPEFGMVSPGVFIPLFEKNGLIQKLDRYVWREAAEQMKRWKEQYGFAMPVSVNVSRIDMYAPDFVEHFEQLMIDNDLDPAHYFIEITESAYTEDSRQIIEAAQRLREKGFKIEMDDFGSGFSSLNMLSELPIDYLKLDIHFVRSMNVSEKNVRMVELIIDIADYLKLPVIAEGVETLEQVETLKRMGCAVLQGYYFSKPLPAGEFSKFIEERIKNA